MTGIQISSALGALSADPDHAEEILVDRLLADTGDHVLRELLLTAALPRAFDANMLATLTDHNPTDDDFSHAFAQLLSNSFVYERSDGLFALHDSIRPALLSRCRADVDSMTERLNRLLDYHNTQYQLARETASALARAGSLIRGVNVHRWSAAADRVEDMLIRPAIEALHVALMMGPDAGWKQLEETFSQFEDESRYRLCGMLASAFAEETDAVPAEAQASHRGWSAYFAARLANDQGLWKEAEQQLASVAASEEIDLKLASWLYTEKSTCLVGQDRYDEALAALDREIVIHDKHNIDPWNAHVPWSGKAEIYRLLWDQDHEVEAWRESIRRAGESGNTAALICGQLQLARTLQVLGDLDSAFDAILAAVRRARLEQELDSWLYPEVVSCVLACLGPRSARLLDSFAVQHRQLAQARWPHSQFELLRVQATALLDGGNAAAAAECLTQARQLAVRHLPDQVWKVDADRAASSVALGEARDGAQLNLALVNDPRAAADRWTRGRCLTNAALNLMSVGEFREALTHTREGRQVWASMHHDHAVSLTWAIEAELLRRTGDLDAAGDALSRAVNEPARGYESTRSDSAARVALDRGQVAQAAAEAERAMAASIHTGTRPEAAKAMLFAAECLLAAQRHAEAAQVAAKAQQLLNEIDAFCRWTPTADTRLADEHAAKAIRIVTSGYGTKDTRLRAACEHLESAANLNPRFGWFKLELAFIDLRQGNNRAAARRLTEAAQLTDDPILRAAIERMHSKLEKPLPQPD